MIVICREVSKNSGEIAVYPIKAPATERLLFQLQIRSRVNPELRYFVVALARWENEELRKQIERLLRRKDVTQRAIDALGGMVELGQAQTLPALARGASTSLRSRGRKIFSPIGALLPADARVASSE